MPPRKCEVCAEVQIKIQVPHLSNNLLFVDMFHETQRHSLQKLETPVKVEVCEPTAPASTVNDEKPIYVEEPSEMLQGVQLELIACSSEIQDAIKDGKLKKLICDIDSAMDPEKELDKVMEVEEFRRLTEKIMSAITP